MADPEDSAEAPDYISYEQWGVAFFDHAVSEQRVLGAVNKLAGQPISVGPIGVGPGKIAQVKATGAIGEALSTRLPGELASWRVVLPVELMFDVNLQLDTQRYHATLDVPLTLTARAAAPLQIVIDIEPPSAEQVNIQLKSEGLRASMLNRMVGIEGEVQRFVSRYVAREIRKPAIAKLRAIDVAGAIDGAMKNIGLPAGETTSRVVAHDFEEAIVEEIRENEETLIEGITE